MIRSLGSAQDGKIQLYIEYDDLTLEIIKCSSISNLKTASKPLFSIQTIGKQELMSQTVDKGSKDAPLGSGLFMVKDPETGDLLPPFEIHLNIPFSQDDK